jgi:hypothetical protein
MYPVALTEPLRDTRPRREPMVPPTCMTPSTPVVRLGTPADTAPSLSETQQSTCHRICLLHLRPTRRRSSQRHTWSPIWVNEMDYWPCEPPSLLLVPAQLTVDRSRSGNPFLLSAPTWRAGARLLFRLPDFKKPQSFRRQTDQRGAVCCRGDRRRLPSLAP